MNTTFESIRIHATSVFNRTDGVGWVSGTIRSRDGDRRPSGRFWATLGSGGALDGFFDGRVNRHVALLLGNLSATFNADSGFSDGKLGSGTSSLPAVLAGRPCAEPKPAPIAVRLVVKGKVESLDSSSITVKPGDASASQTCALRSGVSPSTSRVAVGDAVEIKAIRRLFRGRADKIAVSATKSLIGHTLGAAGALAGITSALTLQTGHIHPTVNYDDPDPACLLSGISRQGQERKMKVGMINAFGFGSNNAAVILKAI